MAQFPHFPFISHPPLQSDVHSNHFSTFTVLKVTPYFLIVISSAFDILHGHTVSKLSFCFWGITTLQNRALFPTQEDEETIFLPSPASLAYESTWPHIYPLETPTPVIIDWYLMEGLLRTPFAASHSYKRQAVALESGTQGPLIVMSALHIASPCSVATAMVYSQNQLFNMICALFLTT